MVYISVMDSAALRQSLREYALEVGKNEAKVMLSVATKLSTSMLDKFIRDPNYKPRPENELKVARALTKILAEPLKEGGQKVSIG